jgi:hypothetical protein
MRQNGRLFSPKSGEKACPFLSTKTVGKKCHNTFTRINSLGHVSRQAPEDKVRLLCFEAIVFKRLFGLASVPVPLLLTTHPLGPHRAAVRQHGPIRHRPTAGNR